MEIVWPQYVWSSDFSIDTTNFLRHSNHHKIALDRLTFLCDVISVFRICLYLIILNEIGHMTSGYKRHFIERVKKSWTSRNRDSTVLQAKTPISFRLPYCRTDVREFSLRFQGPKIFISLSSEIQNASGTALFNSKLESFFLVVSTL